MMNNPLNDCCWKNNNRVCIGRLEELDQGLGCSYIVIQYGCSTCKNKWEEHFTHVSVEKITDDEIFDVGVFDKWFNGLDGDSNDRITWPSIRG